MDYTEEEQIKALKDWWKENGASIVVGVVIALSGFWGYTWWKNSERANQEQASNAYMKLVEIDAKENAEQFTQAATELKQQYSDTGYAVLAALHLAKLSVQQDDFSAAQSQLEWAVSQTEGHSLQALIKIRLARVLNAQQQHQQALTQLESITNEAYVGIKQRVMGDTYLLMDNKVQARAAYAAAKEATDSYIAQNELEMLVNDLATSPVMSSQATSSPVTPEEQPEEQSTKQES